MKSLLTLIDNLSQWTGKFFSATLLLTVLVIGHEVIRRYVFRAPTLWGFEVMVYLCGILYVMSGAYALYMRRHVIKEVIYGRLPPRGRAISDVITFPFSLLFFAVLLYAGAIRFWEAWSIRETAHTLWAPPIYPLILTIPAGALLLILQSVADFIRNLHHAVTGRELN